MLPTVEIVDMFVCEGGGCFESQLNAGVGVGEVGSVTSAIDYWGGERGGTMWPTVEAVDENKMDGGNDLIVPWAEAVLGFAKKRLRWLKEIGIWRIVPDCGGRCCRKCWNCVGNLSESGTVWVWLDTESARVEGSKSCGVWKARTIAKFYNSKPNSVRIVSSGWERYDICVVNGHRWHE